MKWPFLFDKGQILRESKEVSYLVYTFMGSNRNDPLLCLTNFVDNFTDLSGEIGLEYASQTSSS